MKHVVDEASIKSPQEKALEEAMKLFVQEKKQVLAIKHTSGFQYVLGFFQRLQENYLKELRSAPLENDEHRRNIFQVRGALMVVDKFLSLIHGFEISEEREKAEKAKKK